MAENLNFMQSKSEPALEFLFHPKSIAVVGVSGNMDQWNVARKFLRGVMGFGFKGDIYPVGLKGGRVFGRHIYPTIKDIPDSVDYVISAIPAQNASQLIADCASKKVKAIHMFTAGLGELGGEEEKRLESRLVALAREAGIRIIGPNCMGIYCPKTGLSFTPDVTGQSGSVGLLSQSGGNAEFAVKEGEVRGIYFSKVISYGNAADLDETDFLEYFTEDTETRIIAAYIEGVRDGRRFFRALKRAAQTKPVVVYKGGVTEEGARAVNSHTGSIAGSSEIWRGLLKQAGTIQVESVEELVDMALLFNYTDPASGKNIAIIGVGGGAGILAADESALAGLHVPRFSVDLRRKLEAIAGTEAGSSFKNPVDIFPYIGGNGIQRIIEVTIDSGQVDLLLAQIEMSWMADEGESMLKIYMEPMLNLAKKISRRTVVVLHHSPALKGQKLIAQVTPVLSKAGYPVFPSISRAAKAISKFMVK